MREGEGMIEKKDEIISLLKEIVEELQKTNRHLSANESYTGTSA
jgi:hypothetical protein